MTNNILEDNEESLKYSACITDIPQEDYYTWYTARGFIKFTDYNGIDRILYTEQSQSCMYKVAAETAKEDLTNPFAALHTSKTLTESEKLRLKIAKLEIENERLKKGYQVKGVGGNKVFVSLKDVNTK